MTVRYSPRASADLIVIADYLTERSPRGVRSVEAKIRATIELLGIAPGSGRALEERPEVRVLPVVRYPYLIFCTMEADDVYILHIRHAARAPVRPDQL